MRITYWANDGWMTGGTDITEADLATPEARLALVARMEPTIRRVLGQEAPPGHVRIGERTYTDEEIRKVFQRVTNRADWKRPINKLLPLKEADDETLAVLEYAIPHFTGSSAEFSQTPRGVRVTADGYYAAIGS